MRMNAEDMRRSGPVGVACRNAPACGRETDINHAAWMPKRHGRGMLQQIKPLAVRGHSSKAML
eukprot:5191998-Pleurochrysis_carterae.AAC.3